MGLAERHYLVIGAGCVGQVLGAFLSSGGAQVSFWVKPEQIAAFRESGMTVARFKSAIRRHIDTPNLLERPADLAGKIFDAAFVCTRSENLASLWPVLEALSPNVALVSFLPGFRDVETLQARFPERHFLMAYPGFHAFCLNREVSVSMNKRRPILISDPRDPINSPLVRTLLADLQAVDLPARMSTDVRAETREFFAFGMPFLLGLEYHGWHSLATIYDHRLLKEAFNAADEARRIIRNGQNLQAPRCQRWLFKAPRILIRMLMNIYLASPDSHQYRLWSLHGPKIRAQTHAMTHELLKIAAEKNLPAPALQALLARIEKLSVKSSGRISLVQG